MTENEKKKRAIRKEVDAFMETVEAFLRSKNGGVLPEEWGLSLMMLRTYYEQFIAISREIDSLDSLVYDGRYGPQPTPLLGARDKAAMRLESMMKELGLTLKAASKLDIVEPVKEESVLEKFVKGKIEKR